MDETFQKRISPSVKQEAWKRNPYTCVVQHKSLKKDIQKILTEDDIISHHTSWASLHTFVRFYRLDVMVVIVTRSMITTGNAGQGLSLP
ncbi:hypothetical protein QQF64_026905 [Cirrhinus molitorella]|uniref:Uncharacterized protein n=1 Tax=Cirrhinus molitorella TaxID=172907 RepID=A0ABR3NAV2_9TELE